jgi:transcriptional regulator with XRE-family HTH domain
VNEDGQNLLGFANVQGKKVEADFEGGAVTSDGGALFLRVVETGIGVIRRLVDVVRDRRHASYIDHTMKDLISQRVYQIACGYEDANDANTLRLDPGFKTACERLTMSGPDLASQPTLTRLENNVSRSDLLRMAYALADVFVASYDTPPKSLILDVDDTNDPTHGAQIEMILKRVVAYLRQAWPQVELFLRADSHFSVPQVHDFCDRHEVHFVLGQASNSRLKELVAPWLTQAQALYREQGKKVRLFTSFSYQADSWSQPRRLVAKVEVSSLGDNVRFVTTSLDSRQPSFIYDRISSARGRMEGFIKNHKTFLHSDRTSCHSFKANQFRLFLHSAAYMLLHALAEKALPATQWEHAYFDTLQKRLLKIGARVEELRTKVKFHFPSSFPLKQVYGYMLARLQAAWT